MRFLKQRYGGILATTFALVIVRSLSPNAAAVRRVGKGAQTVSQPGKELARRAHASFSQRHA